MVVTVLNINLSFKINSCYGCYGCYGVNKLAREQFILNGDTDIKDVKIFPTCARMQKPVTAVTRLLR